MLTQSVIEDIRGTRERVILSIVETCYQLVELYGSKENHCAADVSRCGHRAGEDARADCDAMVFNSLMRRCNIPQCRESIRLGLGYEMLGPNNSHVNLTL